MIICCTLVGEDLLNCASRMLVQMLASTTQDKRRGCHSSIPVHFGFEEKQACKSDWLDLAVLYNATFLFFMGKTAEARDSTAKMDLKHPLARVVEKLVRQPHHRPDVFLSPVIPWVEIRYSYSGVRFLYSVPGMECAAAGPIL